MSKRQMTPDGADPQIEWVLKQRGEAGPQSGPDRGPRFWRYLIFGVIFPAAVIAFEASTRMCAGSLFDPMPTLWHALLVASVPAINLLSLLALTAESASGKVWLPYLNGAAIAISGFYALLFLPVLPVAVIGIIFYGIGLLPMGPLASFIAAWKLRTQLAARIEAPRFTRPVWIGAALGLVALIALDVPQAATRLGLQWAVSNDTARRERGLTLLRTLGDRDLLLRLAYDGRAKSSGLLSLLVTFGGAQFLDVTDRSLAQSPEQAREIYYRAFGEPFNLVAPPQETGPWARFGDFAFDGDHGGAQVGGRIKGLDLLSSRIDGSINGPDAVAYLEWVLEFRNTSGLAREARVAFDLPPGAVVSRATLWINGEEREAAYGGREAVRKAYNEVAVQQRRDPLLVTTKGADRVLAQAFPVPVNGTLKFKIGITAPLDLTRRDSGVLTLPSISDRNFTVPAGFEHALWIESKSAVVSEAKGLEITSLGNGNTRIAGAIGDRELALSRPEISAERGTEADISLASLGDTAVQQSITEKPAAAAGPLLLLVDGSARMAAQAAAMTAALETIPEGRRVGLMIAAEPMVSIPIAPWSKEQAAAIKAALRDADFHGGQDNTPAFVAALKTLEPEADAEVLWVHGAQPVRFRATASLFEQAGTRLMRYPKVTLYAVEPGPNELMPDEPWAWAAHALPAHGNAEADLKGYFARRFATGLQPVIERQEAAIAGRETDGSQHLVRLWARDKVAAMLSAAAEANRSDAIALAAQYQLVTPVSGAVVLEIKEQFDRHDLKPVSKATVPTVPEPHEWALIILMSLILMWTAWRHRDRFEGGL